MQVPTVYRQRIARRLHANAQVTRQDIFGVDDPQRPLNLPEDTDTMFAGYVGREYRPGGTVLLSINPGGGGDAYVARKLDDEFFYPLLQRLRESPADDLQKIMSAFEAINDRFAETVRIWNIWRVIEPTLQAAGGTLAQAAYLNAVPYRTRGDRKPWVRACRNAWDKATGPLVSELDPNVIVALGYKARDVVCSHYEGTARIVPVKRMQGDAKLTPAGEEALAELAAWRAGQSAGPCA